jgi:hypothetical protein
MLINIPLDTYTQNMSRVTLTEADIMQSYNNNAKLTILHSAENSTENNFCVFCAIVDL